MAEGLELQTESYSTTHKEYVPTVFIAPTEPARLRELGLVKQLPEQYGVDIMWESVLGKIGIQRKEFPNDFLASVHDGRLNKEYAQMRALEVPVLLLEGRQYWTNEGNLVRDRGGKRNAWTRTQHRNYLASVQLRGVLVLTTDSLSDTVDCVDHLRVWSNKRDHTSLDTRPGPTVDIWHTPTNTDFQSHLLQGVPGLGPKQADAILTHLGFPLRLAATRDELLAIPGIGKGMVKKLTDIFGGLDEHPDSAQA